MPRRKPHTKIVLEGAEVAQLDRTALDATRYKPSLTRLTRIFRLWIAAHERGWSRLSLTYRQREMHRICEVLGLTEISEIGRKHIQEFIDHRRRVGTAESSIIREYATLVNMLEWCFRQKIIAENAARITRRRDYGLPPTHPRKAPR